MSMNTTDQAQATTQTSSLPLMYEYTDKCAGGLNDDLAAEIYCQLYPDTIGVFQDQKNFALRVYQKGFYDDQIVGIVDRRITEISVMLKGIARDVIEEIGDDDTPEAEKDLKVARALKGYSSSIRNDRHRAAIRSRIASMNHVPAGKVDVNKRYVSLPNGSLVIDQQARTVIYDPMPHPEALNTFVAGAPYKEGATCPEIENFVIEALSYKNTGEKRTDLEDIKKEARAFRACVGYGLLCGNPEQRVFMMRGSSRSGKGTLASLMLLLYGSYGKMGRRDLVVQQGDKIRSDLGTSVKKFVVIADELRKNDVIDGGGLRYMTDPIIITEVKHGNPVEGQNNMKIWIITNFENPIDTDEAMLNRIVCFLCYRPKPEVEDPLLAEKLFGTGEGFLQYAIAGLRDYFENGVEVMHPEVVRGRLEEYLEQQDRIRLYLDDCLPRSTDGNSELLSDVFAEHQVYYQNRGEKPPATNSQQLGRMLRERKYDVRKMHGEMKVVNVVRIRPAGSTVQMELVEVMQKIRECLTKYPKVSIGGIRAYMATEQPRRVEDIVTLMRMNGNIMEVEKGMYAIAKK